MVSLEYKDLDEVYKGLCFLPFHRLDEIEDEIHLGGSWWLYGVGVKSNGYNCTIDMAKLNYTTMKWNILKNKYIDKEKYQEFKEYVKTTSSKTATFNFKEHEGKGGCLIAMVLSRHSNSKPFDKLTIHYRVTEVFKKFAIDLILINKICNDLLNFNCDIQEVTLFFPALFYRVEFMAELIDRFHNKEDFNKNNRTCKKVLRDYEKFYGEGAEESKYHSIQRKQKLRKKATELPSIPIESLSL